MPARPKRWSSRQQDSGRVDCRPTATPLPVGRENPSEQFFVMHDEVLQAAQEFDVVHLSMDDLQSPAVRQLERPTLHGRLDLAE
jgi:hypothetical protein